jgi:general secretion pathway protein G
VVIIILGLVAGLVGPRLFGRVGQSKQAAAKAQIGCSNALDQYRLDVGSFVRLRRAERPRPQPERPELDGPYLKKPAVPSDPWGKPYQYKCCPGDHGEYDIVSYGLDGVPGGEDENADVTSWSVK